MSWSVFLQTDHAVKQIIRSRYAIKENDSIPTRMLLPASAVVAMVNTTIVMPFDCVKTHLEKVNPSANYLEAVQQIYRQSGNSCLGFFTGVRLRFLLHLTNAIFAVNILEKLESLKKNI